LKRPVTGFLDQDPLVPWPALILRLPWVRTLPASGFWEEGLELFSEAVFMFF
jgi:hypothetical protein